ncbi:MAG: flagellar M-ring protein FliF [Burkholderiales bacterium]|nr:flagellar M-ring protein FliF [Burkholderiales bacterium]
MAQAQAQAQEPGVAASAPGLGNLGNVFDLAAFARGFNQLSQTRKIALAVGIAALVAIVFTFGLASRSPDFKVLFANVSDRDGGAIVASLQQMNVPYRMAEGGGAILVPADMVYETRLRLASQGLPRGGGVGFELMENQKFGTSQFAEQVNYQRALEGELARSIQSLASVESARVHLAIPRPSVFIREQQKPSASVLVALYRGRALDEAQVAGIVHLLSSSVPDLSPKSVTVVDQDGELLSGQRADAGTNLLDPSQLKYLHQVEATIATRIENILRPLTGPENVRAQVAASLDFSETEQTSEVFKPNPTPQDQSIRSLQSSESNSTTPQPAQGVPGALSNQPPGAAAAPLVQPAPGAQVQPPGAASAPPPPATSSQKDQTVNYEVDKTIRHTKAEVGAIRRLSVAVVVNHRTVIEDGKPVLKPLSDRELAQVTDLAREAMGFSKERGDTLNVVNAPFRAAVAEVATPMPFWENPTYRELANEWGKPLLIILAILVVVRMLLSAVRDVAKLNRIEPELAAAGVGADGEGLVGGMLSVTDADGESTGGQGSATPYDADLQAVRAMAKENPAIVAQVVKDWVGRDE